MSKLGTLIKQLTEYNEWQQFKKMADRIREDYGVELTRVYAGRHGATLTTQPVSNHPSLARENVRSFISQYGSFDYLVTWTPDTPCPELPAEVLAWIKEDGE